MKIKDRLRSEYVYAFIPEDAPERKARPVFHSMKYWQYLLSLGLSYYIINFIVDTIYALVKYCLK